LFVGVEVALVEHLAHQGIVELVEILGQPLTLVPHDVEGGEQHGVLMQFPEFFPLRKMLQQPSGFFPGLGRVGRGVPTADKGVL
jgi:hypothetical protein